MPTPALFLFVGGLTFVASDFQLEPQLIGRQRSRCKARANLFEHPVQEECQRLEQLDGIFEFNGFFEFGCRFGGNKRALSASPRQLVKPQTFLSQSLAECNFGQRGESTKIADTPALKRFEHFFRGLQEVNWQVAKPLGFIPWFDDSQAREAARRMHGCMRIDSDSN